MRKKALKTAKKFFVLKVAQIREISGNFGCFLPCNKDLNPCLEDPDFLSPAKKGQRVGSLNPNPWIRNNTTFGVFSDAFPGLKMWVTFACATANFLTHFIISIAVLENVPPEAGLQKRATFRH
jgi:hypothetical protein